MSAYVKALMSDTAAEDRRRRDRQEDEITKARERLAPLEQRVAKLLSTIPIELQREGLAMASLQQLLRGKWRGHAHPGQVGTALRRLGFRRERRWRDGDGFRAVWRRG